MNRILDTPRLMALAALVALPFTAGCNSDGPSTTTPAQATAAADEHADGEHTEGEAGHEEGGEHAEAEEGEIVLTAAQMREAGVVVDSVTTRALAETFTAPARIVPSPTGTAHAGALVPGRITRILVAEGASVGRGAALAEIESMEVARYKGDYVRARAELDQSRAALARQEALAAENLTPARNLEEARATFRTAGASLSAAATQLVALGIAPGSIGNATGAPVSPRVVVRSPIAGTVTKQEAQLGEYVDPTRDLFEISAGGSPFAEAQVPAARTGGLQRGTRATLTTADGTRYNGRVVSVAPVVSAETRTVPVRIEITSGSLRPETFVTAAFEVGTRTAVSVVVPPGAIEREGAGAFVYVEKAGEPGAFERVRVEVAEETADGVALRAGLRAGQRVVTAGTFYLRSARQKGELAEHDH